MHFANDNGLNLIKTQTGTYCQEEEASEPLMEKFDGMENPPSRQSTNLLFPKAQFIQLPDGFFHNGFITECALQRGQELIVLIQ